VRGGWKVGVYWCWFIKCAIYLVSFKDFEYMVENGSMIMVGKPSSFVHRGFMLDFSLQVRLCSMHNCCQLDIRCTFQGMDVIKTRFHC
jgi:hypothetical protein